jgi:hypothetical protein
MAFAGWHARQGNVDTGAAAVGLQITDYRAFQGRRSKEKQAGRINRPARSDFR